MSDFFVSNDAMRDRIFFLLKKRGMTQKELAKKLNVNAQTITDWKKGKSSSFSSMLGPLSIALETSPAWLFAGKGQEYMSNNEREERDAHNLEEAIKYSNQLMDEAKQEVIDALKTVISKGNLSAASYVNDEIRSAASFLGTTPEELFGENTRHSPGAVRISVLGTIPAGIPIDAVEDILDWEEIPASWTTGDREYFGLRVKGDSMYPRYLEGDTVILRKQNTCDSGDDCAVLVNGDAATLKQVLLREDGAVELRPVNPTYPPRTYSPAEVESLPVQVIGVVVELRRKIK